MLFYAFLANSFSVPARAIGCSNQETFCVPLALCHPSITTTSKEELTTIDNLQKEGVIHTEKKYRKSGMGLLDFSPLLNATKRSHLLRRLG